MIIIKKYFILSKQTFVGQFSIYGIRTLIKLCQETEFFKRNRRKLSCKFDFTILVSSVHIL